MASSSNGSVEVTTKMLEEIQQMSQKGPFVTNCVCCQKNLEMLQLHQLLKANNVSQDNPNFFFRLWSLPQKMDCEECEAVKLRLHKLPSTNCYKIDKDGNGYILLTMKREHAHFMLKETSVYRHVLGAE